VTETRDLRICFVGLDNLPVLAREYNKDRVGGEQVQQTLLARAFARLGFNVSMVVADHGQPDGAVWDGVTTYKAYRMAAGIPMFRFIHPRWTGMWSAVARARADVYYTSCAGYQLGLLAMYARRQQKRPRLIFRIAHDRDCDPRALLIQYWRDRKLYEHGLARTDVILAQSEQQQKMMSDSYGHQSVLARMLLDRPTDYLDGGSRDIPLLWVNNVRDFKRPDLALDLASRMPDTVLHMIGGTQPGFEKMYHEIHERARTIPSVVFHGPVPYHDVNDYYGRARVFLNTSDSEGFPNSYLQAWVRGTPVVAFFDPGGIIVREGLGYIASSLDDMRQMVARLLEDSVEWRALSERCRQYMRRDYAEEKILAPYLAAVGGGLT
jgi:glycosyltransferase involved in cell wall biosynthesis